MVEENYDYEESDEYPVIILDNGTGFVKVGFAGDDSPKSVFPNIYGTKKGYVKSVISSGDNEEEKVYLANHCKENAGVLNVKYIFEDGKVKDWYGFKRIQIYAIETELRSDPTNHAIMFTEPPKNPFENKVKMIKIALEDIGATKCNVNVQAVLSLYSTGRTTGLVLDSGDGITHTCCIFSGYHINPSTHKAAIAGREITRQCLKNLNSQNGIDLGTASNGLEICKDIKESVCRVAQEYDKELNDLKNDKSLHKDYELPDGQVVSIGTLQVMCHEILFQPETFGSDEPGTTEILEKSISNSNIDIRKELYKNSVLSGGTTMSEGFCERVLTEYKSFVAPSAQSHVQISAGSNRKFHVFTGAAICCTLSHYTDKFITKEDLENYGDEIFTRKSLY